MPKPMLLAKQDAPLEAARDPDMGARQRDHARYRHGYCRAIRFYARIFTPIGGHRGSQPPTTKWKANTLSGVSYEFSTRRMLRDQTIR
jgi:hypothetical protein